MKFWKYLFLGLMVSFCGGFLPHKTLAAAFSATRGGVYGDCYRQGGTGTCNRDAVGDTLPPGEYSFTCTGNTPKVITAYGGYSTTQNVATTTVADVYIFSNASEKTTLQMYADLGGAQSMGYNSTACNSGGVVVFNEVSAAPYLTWVQPTATTTPPFNTWDLKLGNASGTSGLITINYGSAYPNTHQDFMVSIDGWYTPAENFISIMKSTSLADARYNTEWTATANYYADTTYPVPTSSIPIVSSTITFTVLPLTANASTSPPTGTSTPAVTCDSQSGFWQNSFCNLGIFLFYPGQDTLDKFSGLKATFSQKPPFGYFTSFKNALGGLANGTSSIVLMNTSTTEAFSAIFTPLRNGLVWILWLLFTFWGIHKFRNIEL